MNDIKLQEGHPVDENLRPLKVGGKATAIETAQHGNGARVNGDFEVTGDITGDVTGDITGDVTGTAATVTGAAQTAITSVGTLTDLAMVSTATTTNALGVQATALTTGNGINLNVDDSLTSASDKSLLYIDYDKSGVAGSSVISATTGLSIDMKDAATNNSSSIVGMIGAQIDIDSASSSGVIKQVGLILNVAVDDTGDVGTTGGIEMQSMDGGTDFKNKSSAQSGDYFTINTIEDGETTLTTVEDGGGSTAHLNLDADGDITLNSASGNFIAENAGTEFSAANSAYAGMILGYTAIGIHGADTSYAVTASFAVTDADHKVTFIAPPSGKVEIEVSIYGNSSSIRQLFFGLSDNATYANINFPAALTAATNEHIIADIQIEGLPREFIHKWVVEGLTAGDEYEWWLGAKAEQAGRITLYWGGNATGEYAPFIMKATALPATIYTG